MFVLGGVFLLNVVCNMRFACTLRKCGVLEFVLRCVSGFDFL